MIARAGLLLLSAAAIAWLALAWADSRVEGDARAVLEDGGRTQQQVKDALRDVERTTALSPDRSTGAALRAALYVWAGRIDLAAEEAEYVVRIEPENAEGWALLQTFTRESDPERSEEAARRLRELNPRGQGPQ